VLAAYQRGWTVIAAISFAAGVVGFLLLVRRPASAVASEPAPIATAGLVAAGSENV
jgi:hypothetical protein